MVNYYYKQDDGSWKKSEPRTKKNCKRLLNGSNNSNMSVAYLNEVGTIYFHMYFITLINH